MKLEWHVDLSKSFDHLAFDDSSRFSEECEVFGPAFQESRFESIGPIGDALTSDAVE